MSKAEPKRFKRYDIKTIFKRYDNYDNIHEWHDSLKISLSNHAPNRIQHDQKHTSTTFHAAVVKYTKSIEGHPLKVRLEGHRKSVGRRKVGYDWPYMERNRKPSAFVGWS